MPLQGFPAIMTGGRLGAVVPSFNAGFNFRATAGYVTDGANQTYVLAADAYPTPRGGFTFGWETSTNLDSRDRSTTVGPELAGLHFHSNTDTTTNTFRADLPTTGSFTVYLGIGDAGSNDQSTYMHVQDNTTDFITFNPIATVGLQFADAAGNVWSSPADWNTNNAGVIRTFASTILRVVIAGTNSGSLSSVIAHLGVVQN